MGLSAWSKPTINLSNPELVKACGGDEQILKWSVLDLKGRRGWTNQIDFLLPNDLTEPIMRGTDDQGRHFLAFRYLVRHGIRDQIFVETIYQPKANFPQIWRKGTCNYATEIDDKVEGHEQLTSEHYSRLEKLINHQPLKSNTTGKERLENGDLVVELH